MIRHFILTAYQCATCDECFDQPNTLQHHLRLYHSDQLRQNLSKIQKCIVCSENIDPNKNEYHVCVQGKTMRCEYCVEVFSSTPQLLYHLNVAHIRDKSNYACDRCPKIFGMKLLLDCHRLSHDNFDQGIKRKLKCEPKSCEYG